MTNPPIANVRLFLLDMDGTIYLDEQLFDGTLDFLHYLRRTGRRYLFLTNNSSRGIDAYLSKMQRLGIEATADDFLTSVDATIDYLNRHGYRNKRIYGFGTASFRKQLTDAGFSVTDRLEDKVEVLVSGFDRELTFQKLEDACILLNRGVDWLATNPDWVCPTWYGYVPDCGSVCQMLTKATGRTPKFIGKPEPEMALLAMEKYGVSKDRTMVVGDRIYTDIACGVHAGIWSAFVLSGEGTMADVENSPEKPTHIYQNIRALLRQLEDEERTVNR